MSSRSTSSAPAQQRGIVLVVALIVLVVMALVGLGMMRQTSSGVSIAGNVSIRQSALSAADSGTDLALSWLASQFAAASNGSNLNNDIAVSAYYATWGLSAADADPIALFAPTSPYSHVDSTDGINNTTSYIIQRLCMSIGSPNAIGQKCSVNDQAAANSTKGGYPANYGSAGNVDVPPPLYRISARVVGPKNTISYTQVIVE